MSVFASGGEIFQVSFSFGYSRFPDAPDPPEANHGQAVALEVSAPALVLVKHIVIFFFLGVLWPRQPSRKGRLPAPGGRTVCQPKTSLAAAQKHRIMRTRNRNMAKRIKQGILFRTGSHKGPTTPHSGCLWGGVQSPNESVDFPPLSTPRR